MSDLDARGWIGMDGKVEREAQALVGALEAGASIGWGVFTTGAIIHARPALLERHIARLHGDAIRSRLLPNLADNAEEEEDAAGGWGRMLADVIAANNIERGLFRLTLCARGEGRWHGEGTPRRIVAAVAGSLGASPVEAWLSPYHLDARRPLCGVKSTSYAPWQMMALEARERGCGEALYRDSAGALCEGARSNLFWRRGTEVFTPALSTGCLPGIARGMLVSWLGEARSPWTVREVHAELQELRHADEVFLSSSTLGPRAVLAVRGEAGVEVWRGAAGAAGAALGGRWRAMLESGGA